MLWGNGSGPVANVSVPIAGWEGGAASPEAPDVLLSFHAFPQYQLTRIHTFLDCDPAQETVAKFPVHLPSTLGKSLSVVRMLEPQPFKALQLLSRLPF